MRRYIWLVPLGVALVLLALFSAKAPWLAQKGSEEAVGGLSTPESVAVGPDGKYYVSNVGRAGQRGDGTIKVIEDKTVKELATGLDDPKGIVIYNNALYVADIDKVWKVSLSGQKELFLKPEDFLRRPLFLNDVALAPSSDRLYISDTQLGLIYTVRACLCGGVGLFADRSRLPELQGPNGLTFDKEGNLLAIDFNSGKLLQLKADGSSAEVLGEGFGGGDGLAFDGAGNLYISDYKGGRIFKRAPDGSTEIIVQELKGPADITVDSGRNLLLIPEFDGDRLRFVLLSSGGA